MTCPSESIIVPMEDDLVHTSDTHFFCADPTCPCHEDSILIAELAEAVEAGDLTPEQATSIVSGTQSEGGRTS